LFARGSLERAIEISRRGKRATVNFEDIVTLTNFDARRTQRRLKLGIPVLAGEDPADSVMPVLHRKVGAQQTTEPDPPRDVTASGKIRVTDGELASTVAIK